MNFMLTSNLLTIILCIGVIVQSGRMMQRLRLVSDGQMGAIVAALDRATSQASTVLAGLRSTLSIDGAAVARDVAEARDLKEELAVLIGIANAMADRLAEGSGRMSEAAAQENTADPAIAPETLRRLAAMAEGA